MREPHGFGSIIGHVRLLKAEKTLRPYTMPGMRAKHGRNAKATP
jgi:hypothetical protein